VRTYEYIHLEKTMITYLFSEITVDEILWETDAHSRELIRANREKNSSLYETLRFQWNK